MEPESSHVYLEALIVLLCSSHSIQMNPHLKNTGWEPKTYRSNRNEKERGRV